MGAHWSAGPNGTDPKQSRDELKKIPYDALSMKWARSSSIGHPHRHDSHRHVDVYGPLFLRYLHATRVANVTHLGVSNESIGMFLDFFPRAHIWGVDEHRIPPEVQEAHDSEKGRVHLHGGQKIRSHSLPKLLGLADRSMNLVVGDSTAQDPLTQEQTFMAWWPVVKIEGYYIMEDTSWNRTSGQLELYNAPPVTAEVRHILRHNRVRIFDSAYGHRNASDGFRASPEFMHNPEGHRSRVMVVQKVNVTREGLFQMHPGVPGSPAGDAKVRGPPLKSGGSKAGRPRR